MSIIWKDIKGYEGYYQVSSCGKVKSLDRFVAGKWSNKALRKGKILSPSVSKMGYFRVFLIKDKYGKNLSVHRLVALAFVKNDMAHTQVNHIDGIKSTNHMSNLEWCDITHNNRHARAIGLNVTKKGAENHSYGFKNKQSLIAKNLITGELKPLVEISKEYPHYSRRHVTMMLKGERTNKTNYCLK